MYTTNLLNQYSDIYYRILLEDINGINILPFNTQQFKQALKYFKKIVSDQIYQDKNQYLYYIPKEMIFYIKQHLNQQIDQQKLVNCTEDEEILNKIIDKDHPKPFYLIQINPNDISEIKKVIKNYFSKIEENDLQIISSLLKSNINDADGGFITLKNCYVYFLNKELYNDRTIAHQLTHYLQHEYGIYLTETIDTTSNIPIKNISHLTNATKDQLIKLYFNQRQFGTHIDDLLYGLKKIYQNFYNQRTKNELITNFINTFSTYNKHILYSNEQILIQWNSVNKNLSPIKFFIVSYILYKNTAYKKICEQLLNRSVQWK